MNITQRPKPKAGETWIYITGQRFQIVDIETDSTSKEQVIYREDGSHYPVWRLSMDDFMATCGEEGETLICYFQKAFPL